jgi:hypothetical protein
MDRRRGAGSCHLYFGGSCLLGADQIRVACRVFFAGPVFRDGCGHQGSLPRYFAKGKGINRRRGAGRRLLIQLIGGLSSTCLQFYKLLTLNFEILAENLKMALC